MKFGVLVSMTILLSSCGFDGGPIITKDSNHKINFGGDLEDTMPLSLQVRQALRSNPQTALSRIQVSNQGDGRVQLAGYVDNDGIRQEAERQAGLVPGVQFVVNNLNIR